VKHWFTSLLFWFLACAANAAEFHLYGGEEHDAFLGCLNCGQHDPKSICNKYGKGSEHSSASIFNDLGTFGNPNSASSPWNRYSSEKSVPIVVDAKGKFYGHFTINREREDAVAFVGDLADIFEDFDGQLGIVRDAICAAFD